MKRITIRIAFVLFGMLTCLSSLSVMGQLAADKYADKQTGKPVDTTLAIGSKETSHLLVGASFYTDRPEDSHAVYFTPAAFGVKADGKTDVSDALQRAINQVKRRDNFGIVFIPPGKYMISKTIYIPASVRLIGYGRQRPVIRLKDHALGFDKVIATDKGKASYMFWFISGIYQEGQPVEDAGAGTFYSALSNINLEIGRGNTEAVALRTHFAQHSYVEHVDIHIGEGKAGIFDVGNEIQDVRFFGGDYGIYTTKASPGWQFMMMDTYFEGQHKAAIRSQEAGLTIIRMQVENTPAVIDVDSGFWEKLYMEDCRFDQISGAAIRIGLPESPNTQVNLKNIDCRNVPHLLAYKGSERPEKEVKQPIYRITDFSEGLMMDSLAAEPESHSRLSLARLDHFEVALRSDLPVLPPVKEWVNVKLLGAKGDGIHDDTKILQEAIDHYPVIYLPQGWYNITRTLQLKPNTVLIGLHPFGTQLILPDNTPAFGSFGRPVPLVASSKGGRDILTGIGISTGKKNSSAVACKWTAGATSYINDVKFVGGHGGLRSDLYKDIYKNGSSSRRTDESSLWDRQYWSLWVTAGGGGTFKNIWSASTFASAGVYIAQTATPGRIYALSVEHHVRSEVRFNQVSGWKIYALQTEEESRESTDCQPLTLDNCTDLMFANLYMFRVIRVNRPYPYAIVNAGSRNVSFLNLHNYAQTKFPSGNSLYDRDTRRYVRSWELAGLHIGGSDSTSASAAPMITNENKAGKSCADGFEFAEGLCSDSKGNVYFCESRMKRIYKWSVETGRLSLLADYPWEPLSLACDEQDHLLVVFKYVPTEGYLNGGQPEVFMNPPDASGTSFSGWGNSGFAIWVYSLDPNDPDHTIALLKKVPVKSVIGMHKAYYPAHRWRDFHDFASIVIQRPNSCWLAPDGKTIIPVVYDLARATALVAAEPGKPLYVTDEYNELTYSLAVDGFGYVSDLKLFAPKGSFGLTKDGRGNVWIIDGLLYGYNKAGHLFKTEQLPFRPTGVTVGGKQMDKLFITGYHGLYVYQMP
ncbi:MAG TPA: glycosyl hydrolase family 28-related protein [Arachidicoccus sp.]|nr:glycosyl hydrolase family 28-related protein [Arachidicoccus sp.]